MNLVGKVFKKIPIVISPFEIKANGLVVNWRAEIADSYENYHTMKYEDINFEDILFHFNCDIGEMEPGEQGDQYTYKRKKDAVASATYVATNLLPGKCKIWFA